jgi:putative DNA primase/helicase
MIKRMLAGYSVHMPAEALMVRQSQQNGASSEVARLKGARFVSAVEADEGRRLSEALIKQLTGGDTIAARFLYGNLFEFEMNGKIWLSTNHKPVIRGTDDAIWRRIRLVPFDVTFRGQDEPLENRQGKKVRPKDTRLLDKLRAELPGILTWAVKGCLAWQRDGLGMPDVIRSATSKYQGEMDQVAQFISDCCVEGQTGVVSSKEIYLAYSTWAEEGRETVMSKKAFGERLAEKGFQPHKGSGGTRCWKGLSLLSYQFRS